MNDCVQKAPSVPMDEGTLQASGSVFVESHLTGTSEGLSPASHGTPARDHRESSGRHETVAVIGFNQPQAARLHEHPEYNFQRKKGTEGGKFLETKLVVYRRDYLEIVADTLREMK
ncbi:hypothetical protein HQ520_16305 [bacterium]|nr:hypothetical protein [bacterium]